MSPTASPSKPTRSSSTIILEQPDAAEHQELHHLAESLTEQNSVLRAQVTEVQSLLDASQNETARLQSELDDAQAHVQHVDHSLADEVFSVASSRQPSPALQQNPQWDASSEPDSVSSMSYNRPDGSSKPAFGHMNARRRKSGGPSAAAVASMLNNTGSSNNNNNRPKSFSLPRPSLINRRTNSVDMGNLYSFKASDDSQRAPLESIADTSPAVSRAGSKEPLPEPVSPTASRTFNSASISPAPHLLTTCEAAVQTDAEPAQPSSAVPFLHSPVPSTSSESRLPFFSSTSHKPSSSVTSDSLSEQDKFFISNAHQHSSSSPAEHLSPDGNYLSATPSTSHMDLRTTALPSLLDASTKLLLRVRNANLASLEARLKKQHLPGDVAHLAKSTVKDIVSSFITPYLCFSLADGCRAAKRD